MNAARTELQKRQRAQLAELVNTQQAIANGRPPPLPDGKTEVFHWHPTIPSFCLRQYASGRGTWQLQYRTRDGQKRTYPCGNAVVTTLKQAEKTAHAALQEVRNNKDPQGDRRELRAKPNRLILARLERHRPELADRVKAKELSAAQAATAAGFGKPTVGALCEEYFEEMGRSKDKLSPLTLDTYRSLANNHFGKLRGIPFDDLDKRRNDISARVRQINAEVSRHTALHFRSMLSSVYEWAMAVYPDDIKFNPVPGTWRPERPKKNDDDDHNFLLRPELAAIWRGCESMAAAARATYKGNAWGETLPTAANSIRADSVLLTRAEAARQIGIRPSLLWHAIEAGELKPACMRRDLAEEEHPLKIKQGYHRRTYLLRSSDVTRWAAQRGNLFRSPQHEYSVIVRLLLLLGLRYSQIGGLRWSELGELDSRDKFVPSTSISVLRQKPMLADGDWRRGMKAKRGSGPVLLRYLPPPAVELINTIERRPGRDLLFGTGPHGMLENDRYKKQLDQKIPSVNDGAPIREWHLHLLRHSFTTHIKELGCPPHIMSAMLNHASAEGSRTTGIYDHATYMAEQKKWMDPWAARILNDAHRIEDDQTNVTPLPRPAESA
jgi:integrase